MVMNWTTEANTKLFIGILEQLKNQSMKLDYKGLAEHMGPECSVKSIQNQFTRLKKQAAEEYAGQSSGQSAGASSPAAPASTPKKRGATAGSKTTTPAKKTKKKSDGEGDAQGGNEVEKGIITEAKQELKHSE
ncbi:hypothetical protein BDW59DRAFT_160793 [Aspergillus cavernicola]|uniref:Uncharacterized protein n=1 Tax=Aspergillus cavernicola TaxID=176166 RepID=A0ABR4IFU2_9EURO